MFRFLSAALAAAIILTGCNQDTTGQATQGKPAAERPEVTSKDFGDYILYFSAMPTDLLQPEIAQAYNIVRSKNRALLNVAIIKKIENTTGESITADIRITANNLTGQVKNLTLREIQEGDAIYYIGDVPVANAETLVFDLDVKPQGANTRYPVRFTRQFFSD